MAAISEKWPKGSQSLHVMCCHSQQSKIQRCYIYTDVKKSYILHFWQIISKWCQHSRPTKQLLPIWTCRKHIENPLTSRAPRRLTPSALGQLGVPKQRGPNGQTLQARKVLAWTYWMSACCLCVKPSPHMYSAHNNGYSIWGQWWWTGLWKHDW